VEFSPEVAGDFNNISPAAITDLKVGEEKVAGT
jgi:hypothetical protein